MTFRFRLRAATTRFGAFRAFSMSPTAPNAPVGAQSRRGDPLKTGPLLTASRSDPILGPFCSFEQGGLFYFRAVYLDGLTNTEKRLTVLNIPKKRPQVFENWSFERIS